MPHKHTRRDKDLSLFDLPPSRVAKPLPVNSQSKKDGRVASGSTGEAVKSLKRRRHDGVPKNDAPRAFKRLMAYAQGKKPRSGLDDGESEAKAKKKKLETDPKSQAEVRADAEAADLKIRPGERMSEFSARVDAALPLSGLAHKTARNGQDPLGGKVWRTNKERKMHKLYDEWHEEERKIKERLEEKLEEQAEKAMEEEDMGIRWNKVEPLSATGKKTKAKKGKRSKVPGEVSDDNNDPWEELRKKRGETRPGLHDVAKAPPELNMKLPKKLTVRAGAAVDVDGIPKAAGSLRRREELQGVRYDVVAQYRALMDGKRPTLRK